MKQDYLFDKEGNDAEVEGLEILLSEFRLANNLRPESNVIEFSRKSRSAVQTWVFAIAACVVLGTVFIGVWGLIWQGSAEMPLDIPRTEVQQVPAELADVRDTKTSLKSQDPPWLPQRVNSHAMRISASQQKYAAVDGRISKRYLKPKLTQEEKYAYNQVLLALSITSSKLRLVQDSINGVDQLKTNDK